MQLADARPSRRRQRRSIPLAERSGHVWGRAGAAASGRAGPRPERRCLVCAAAGSQPSSIFASRHRLASFGHRPHSDPPPAAGPVASSGSLFPAYILYCPWWDTLNGRLPAENSTLAESVGHPSQIAQRRTWSARATGLRPDVAMCAVRRRCRCALVGFQMGCCSSWGIDESRAVCNLPSRRSHRFARDVSVSLWFARAIDPTPKMSSATRRLNLSSQPLCQAGEQSFRCASGLAYTDAVAAEMRYPLLVLLS